MARARGSMGIGGGYFSSSQRVLLAMCVPAISFFVVFNYLPLPAIYLAFVRFNYRDGIFGSDFVGLKNFMFLIRSGDLLRITRNTFLYNLAFIFLGNTFAIAVAVMFNELASMFRKIGQTILFLPFFISYVMIGIFVYNLFSYNFGVLNNLLISLGLEPRSFFENRGLWKYVIVATHLWKGTGYASIVYFAAISGIDPQLYEAAVVDGASMWQRITRITIPILKPTFILLILFSLGGIIRGDFGLFFNIVGYNALLYPTTDIIETYVFRSLMVNFNFSVGTAVGLYQSIIGFLLVMTTNTIVRRVEPDYALF